jgi:Mechanosensitive ion channel
VVRCRPAAQVLHVVGVNVQPLLAAGGVSGIALGFGAQKLTQNVLSGAKLFLTQPFVVGERVRLLGSGGGEVVSGVIESVRCCCVNAPSFLCRGGYEVCREMCDHLATMATLDCLRTPDAAPDWRARHHAD